MGTCGSVEAVIDAQLHVMPNPDASDAPAGALDLAQSTHPSLAQQRADAFVALVDRLAEPTHAPAGASASTEGGDTSAERKPRRARVELTLHRRVGEETLLDGAPLPEPSRRLLTCDADLRIMHHYPDGSPADLGRKTPVVSKKLRRLLRERAGGVCERKGCTARHFLQAHHIIHWEDGGRTDLANLRLLCSLHHRQEHAHDIRGAVAQALAA